jgi:prepilin-type processing-associated H-X9-DG protein
MVELLVIIGILAIIVAFLLPSLAAARESARRTACLNNLSQIGKGIMSYDAGRNELPGWRMALPGFTDVAGGTTVSWTVAILPFLGEGDVFDWYDSYAAGVAGVDDVRTKRLSRYVCPSASSLRTASAPLSYMGNGGTAAETLDGRLQWRGDAVFFDQVAFGAIGVGTYDPLKTSIACIAARDGVSSTMLLTERAGLHASLQTSWSDAPLPAVANANAVLTTHVVHHPPTAALVSGRPPQGRRVVNPTPETTVSAAADWTFRYPSSLHDGGAAVAFCDGRTQFMSDRVAPWVYCQTLTTDRRHESPRAVAWEVHPVGGTWLRYVFDERDLTPPR